jgi:hypothetical protein
MSMIRNLIASALLAGAISAKTIPVDVGKNGLTYSQNSITADIGDQVVFTSIPPSQSGFTVVRQITARVEWLASSIKRELTLPYF